MGFEGSPKSEEVKKPEADLKQENKDVGGSQYAKDTARPLESSYWEERDSNIKEEGMTKAEIESKLQYAKDTARMLETAYWEEALKNKEKEGGKSKTEKSSKSESESKSKSKSEDKKEPSENKDLGLENMDISDLKEKLRVSLNSHKIIESSLYRKALKNKLDWQRETLILSDRMARSLFDSDIDEYIDQTVKSGKLFETEKKQFRNREKELREERPGSIFGLELEKEDGKNKGKVEVKAKEPQEDKVEKPEEEVKEDAEEEVGGDVDVYLEPVNKRKEKARELRFSYAEKKEVVANIQNTFLGFIRNSENKPSVAEVREFFNQIDTENPEVMSLFNEKETRIFDQIASEVINKYEVTRKYEEMYEGRPEEFFEALFDKKPIGKIEIEALPIGFYLKCFNSEDFATALGNESLLYDHKKYLGAKIGKGLGIEHLRDMVIVDILSSHPEAMSSAVKIHEEAHILNNIIIYKFEDKQMAQTDSLNKSFKEVSKITDKEQKESISFDLANRVLRHQFKSKYEKRWADEIIAMSKPEFYNDPDRILNIMVRPGDIYDHIDRDRRMILEEEISDPKSVFFNFSIEAIEYAFGPGSEKLRKRQNKLIKEGIEAINKLKETHGIDGATAILDKEPLHRWPKVVERIEEEDVLGLNKEPRV